jgi:ADP-heptose:LPS heptosyltransferase
MHLAAAVGTPVVLLMDKRAPQTYMPLTSALRVIRNGRIDEIKVEEVYQATRELLVSERVSRLTN